MEELLNRPKRIFRSEAEIEQILHEQQQSGRSIKAFCAAAGIAQASFHNWKKKYPDRQSGGDAFVPVGIKVSSGDRLFAEVGQVRLYQPVSAAYLKELLA